MKIPGGRKGGNGGGNKMDEPKKRKHGRPKKLVAGGEKNRCQGGELETKPHAKKTKISESRTADVSRFGGTRSSTKKLKRGKRGKKARKETKGNGLEKGVELASDALKPCQGPKMWTNHVVNRKGRKRV